MKDKKKAIHITDQQLNLEAQRIADNSKGLFRNKTHVTEYALQKFIDECKGKELYECDGGES